LKDGELVLLYSKDESYIITVSNKDMHTKSGVIKLKFLKKKKLGDEINTHLGKKFTIMRPTIVDILGKIAKRLPQIITQKDIGLILAYTGIGPGSNVVDAGTGSGFLAMMLTNYVRPGKVVSYEKNKKFAKIAKENVKTSGLSKFIKIKQKNVLQGIKEKDVDLVTFDFGGSEKAIKYAYKALRPGGWLVVYSPYIEGIMKVVNEIKKKNFSEPKTVENIVREWQSGIHQTEVYTRPKTVGLMHTGFITFARKIGNGRKK
jgi:tRNA (adenine57-N1/adenine58-N1)-methyltransferase